MNPTIVTRSCRQPTELERMAAYIVQPEAIQRRSYRVWPWQRTKQTNVFPIRKRAHG